MIFTTFYFSGTGNTKWAAEEFHKTAEKKGHQSRLVSIEEKSLDLHRILNSTDFMGIAFPVYAMNIPEIMKQFIEKLNKVLEDRSPMPLYVLTTAGFADGCGPYEVVSHFSQRSVRLMGYAGLKMCTNISTPVAKAPELAPGELQKRLETARSKISALVDALSAGKKKIELGVYRIAVFRKQMSSLPKKAHEQLSINPSTCDRCMTCVDSCPTDAIKPGDSGNLSIQSECTACMRCYNYCPTASVWHSGQYADPAEYTRYRGPLVGTQENVMQG
ncbi:MAG: EFR1 family ferrodoxin [Eubacteriales bacterium]